MHLRKARNVLSLALALSTAPVFAGLNTWTSSGPAGGNITTMVADPANPATLYVGTHGAGIYKTEDNGRTWRAVNPGLPELVISSLVNGPDSVTFFAATVNGKLARTEDGGAHWSEVGNVTTVSSELVFDHERQILYVTSLGKLLRSGDLGNTWQSIPTNHNFYAVTASRGRLFAAENPFLYVSDDAGDTWAKIDFKLISAFRIIAQQDGSVFALGDGHLLARSVDLGKNWVELSPLPASYVYALSSYSEGIVASTNAGILRYNENTKAWSLIDPDLVAVSILRTSAEGESIFAFKYTDDTFRRWTTAQNRWEVVNPGLRVAHARDISVAGDSVYAATYEGLARLGEGSEEWEFINTPWSARKGIYAVEATASGEILIGTSDGVRKSVDRGATWASVNPGYSFISALAAAPSDRRTIYAAAYEEMIKSVDGGVTWSGTKSEVPYDGYSSRHGYYDIGLFYGFDATDIKVDPTTPESVYVCGDLAFKSIDGGATWSALSPESMRQLAIDWSNPAVLYGAVKSGVWKSANGGATWQALNLAEEVSAIAIDPDNASVLYAGTPTGKVYRTADSGGTWYEMSGGLNGAYINRIVVDAAGRRIYAATDGGVFEYHDLLGVSTYSVRLSTHYGNFVSAAGCGGGAVNANATVGGTCETFTLVDRDGGELLDGDRVNIKAANGQFLVAENGGATECGRCSSPVNANRFAAGPWELFTIRKMGDGDPRISAGNRISIQSIAGDYIAAEWGGANGCGCDAVLSANRATAREWETFTIVFP